MDCFIAWSILHSVKSAIFYFLGTSHFSSDDNCIHAYKISIVQVLNYIDFAITMYTFEISVLIVSVLIND